MSAKFSGAGGGGVIPSPFLTPQGQPYHHSPETAYISRIADLTSWAEDAEAEIDFLKEARRLDRAEYEAELARLRVKLEQLQRKLEEFIQRQKEGR